MNESFYSKLTNSIIAENTYILVCAIIEFVLLIIMGIVFIQIRYGKKHNNKSESPCYMVERVLNELFITIISIFPLLGLFGTVKALLSIDFSNDFSNDLANAQANFFDALTSTAWGIIFAIIFKVVNSVIAPFMERLFDTEEKRLTRNRERTPK